MLMKMSLNYHFSTITSPNFYAVDNIFCFWDCGKSLAHTLMVRIQNGTISVGSPRGMWKHLLTLYMQISLDSIILFLEPNPKSSWTKIQNDSFKGLYTVMLLVQVKDRNKWNVHWVGNDWINDSQNRILRNRENAYRSTLCTNMKKYTKNRLLSDRNRK